MNAPTDKFYNLQINLLKNGKVYSEKAAVRNVWQKGGTVFLDVYLYRLSKSYVFASEFVHSIVDLSREKSYRDMAAFAADFMAASTLSQPVVTPKKDSNLLAPLDNDIVILLFLAQTQEPRDAVKDKIIFSYIRNILPAAQNLSEIYLRKYINHFAPQPDDFYAALKNIKSKRPEQAERLLRESVKICLSDGCLHYLERMYLADFVQTLRLEGVNLPADLIR